VDLGILGDFAIFLIRICGPSFGLTVLLSNHQITRDHGDHGDYGDYGDYSEDTRHCPCFFPVLQFNSGTFGEDTL